MYDGGVAAATRALRHALRAGASGALAWFAVLGALAAAPVFAARPFLTDDADVIKRGDCEVELVYATQSAHSLQSEGSTSAQLGCGVGLNTELSLAGLRVKRGSDDWPAVAVAGKTGLRPVADGALGVAVGYALLGEKQPGSEFKQTRAAVYLVATESLGNVLVHGNFGFAHDRIAHEGSTIWAVALEHTGERFDVGAEIFGESTRSAWLGVGARYAVLPNRLSVDTSYAIRGNSTRAQRATIGMVLAF
jgi:hypothetical protein